MINVAVMTNVDAAEADPASASGANALGAANVARAARLVGARSSYVSTEAAFVGEYARADRETDLCSPLSVHGVSKLAGEHLARKADTDVSLNSAAVSGLQVSDLSH